MKLEWVPVSSHAGEEEGGDAIIYPKSKPEVLDTCKLNLGGQKKDY